MYTNAYINTIVMYRIRMQFNTIIMDFVTIIGMQFGTIIMEFCHYNWDAIWYNYNGV